MVLTGAGPGSRQRRRGDGAADPVVVALGQPERGQCQHAAVQHQQVGGHADAARADPALAEVDQVE